MAISSDDVILIAEDEEISCTRSSLAEVSPYFQAMFNCEMQEKNAVRVRLHDVSADILRLLVDFAQKKRLWVTNKNAYDLFKAASLFQFDVVRSACYQQLLSSLNVYNCLSFWDLADTFGVEELRRKAKRLALWEGDTVLESETLPDLPKRLFKELISNPGLRTGGEMKVFEALVRWCERNETCDGELIPLIRTSVLPPIENYLYLLNRKENVSGGGGDGATEVMASRATPLVPLLVGTKCTVGRGDQGVKDIHFILLDSSLQTQELTVFQVKWVNVQALVGYGTCVVGKDVYIFGGKQSIGRGDWNQETWKYDSFTEKWKSVATMSCQRRHFVYAVCNGKIYVAGGYGTFRVVLTSCEVYNPEIDTWEDCAPVPCPSFSACLVSHKGKLYFFCNEVFLYDPEEDCWECVRRDPVAKAIKCGLSVEREIYLWNKQDHKLVAYDPDLDTVRVIATTEDQTVERWFILEKNKLVHIEKGLQVLDVNGKIVAHMNQKMPSDFIVERTDRIPWYQLL